MTTDELIVNATAGCTLPTVRHDKSILLFNFSPGGKMAAHAILMYCNGRIPTTNQAILGGAAALGVRANMDQMLDMAALERAGCRSAERADRTSIAILRATIYEWCPAFGAAKRPHPRVH